MYTVMWISEDDLGYSSFSILPINRLFSDPHPPVTLKYMGLLRNNLMERDVAQLVECLTCNPKVVGLSPGGGYHQSLVSPSKKQWSPAGSGQTISSESKSGVSR